MRKIGCFREREDGLTSPRPNIAMFEQGTQASMIAFVRDQGRCAVTCSELETGAVWQCSGSRTVPFSVRGWRLLVQLTARQWIFDTRLDNYYLLKRLGTDPQMSKGPPSPKN